MRYAVYIDVVDVLAATDVWGEDNARSVGVPGFLNVYVADSRRSACDVRGGAANRYMLFEPRSEKTGLRGFRPGPTRTGLYSHRR